jgi:uncharacterized repeat protein (TIGR03803 family)
MVLLTLALLASGSAQAQTYSESVLYSLPGPGSLGGYPTAGLVLDGSSLYGTSDEGGTDGLGSVFRVGTGGGGAVLYSFTQFPTGEEPYGGLVRDAQGNWYGTTSAGGDEYCASSGCGTVFKVSPTGQLTVLHTFTSGGDGAFPYAGLVMDAQGNLYGTTVGGGYGNYGTVFEVDTNGNETVLYPFHGGGDGGNPYAGLVRDAQGNLYGTTYAGGASRCGVVFKIDTNNTETVLYSFACAPDGAFPRAGLVMDAQGNLYGTTSHGGASGTNGGGSGYGTVFKVDSAGNETVLYSFTGTGGDGQFPYAGLVMDALGNLYGTTLYGGAFCTGGGCGAVFIVYPNGRPRLCSTASVGMLRTAQIPTQVWCGTRKATYTALRTMGVTTMERRSS